MSAVLVAALLNGSAIAEESEKPAFEILRACSDEWRAMSLDAMPPGPDDTHDHRTGKLLSQTSPAKRTRALKLQAAKYAITQKCLRRQIPLVIEPR